MWYLESIMLIMPYFVRVPLMKCPVLYVDVLMVSCGGSGSLSQMYWLPEVASELGAGLESRDE